ncbi:hypothetical protein D3C76_1329850 [compost metagenome]
MAHGTQGDVVLPLAHVDHGVGEVELDLHPGAALGEARQQLAHHAIAGADRTGETQAAAVFLGQGLDVLLRLLGQREDLPRLQIERLARLGQAEPAGGALQQLGVEGGLQRADVAAQHPLAHPQQVGRGGEAAAFDHLIEAGQVGDIHPFTPIWKQYVHIKRFFFSLVLLES